MAELALIGVLALAVGLLLGWFFASRRSGTLASDLAVATSRAADADLIRQTRDAVERERNEAHQALSALRAEATLREAAQAAQAAQLADAAAKAATLEASRAQLASDLAAMRAQSTARDEAHETNLAAMRTHFEAAAGQALETAQTKFLARAQQRFTESEKAQGEKIAQLLAPVHERLKSYEENVGKVEAERRNAFGELKGQIEHMRVGQESVRSEAAKLVNALRNAPKARGRWGEQQLRNVLESCGLSEHCDFKTEVSVDSGDGARLRPDVVVKVPGGRSLVIDAKVSLNAYQDAFGAVDEEGRARHLALHVTSMRAHINALGNKSYQSQFDDTPDFVIMFIPGEHFLAAALEHDAGLWDFAFDKKVLLATPTNLVAIAKTVATIWRQEKLAGEARAIAELGRDLYARLCTMGTHVSRLGKNLATANDAYNSFVGSLESQVLTQARRFDSLNIDTGGKTIDSPPLVEHAVRPLTKLTTDQIDS